jgi:hypothetical protein
VLNVVLVPIFMFVFDMGILGCGIGTVLSQIFAFLVLLWIVVPGAERSPERAPNLVAQRRLCLRNLQGRHSSLTRQGTGEHLHLAPQRGGRRLWRCRNSRNEHRDEKRLRGLRHHHRHRTRVSAALRGFNYGARLYDRVRRGYFYGIKLSMMVLAFFFIGLHGVGRAVD